MYQASDLRLQRQVAVKVMMGSLFGDQTALRRFEREARAAAKIDHRHITRVHDFSVRPPICQAKDPRDRYGSAGELARDLLPALTRCEDLGGPHQRRGQASANGSLITRQEQGTDDSRRQRHSGS